MTAKPQLRVTEKINDWIKQLPTGWSAKRLSWVFDVIGSGTTPTTNSKHYYDGDTPWVTTGELRETAIRSTLENVNAQALADFSALRLYPAGTLVLAMYGATIGRLGWLELPATVNQACCAFARPVSTDTRFMFYCLRAAVQAMVVISSGGGQPNINQEKLRAFRVPHTTLSNQIAIAAFLDRETTKIDELITEQERLITLLDEKRQALISHAIMASDTSCQQAWPRKRLRFLAAFNPSRSKITDEDSELEVSFVPMDAIGEDGSVRLDSTCRVSEIGQGYTFFADGDVLIAKITPCFENGKGALARGLLNGKAYGTTELIVVRPLAEHACGGFLYWLFSSPDFRLRAASAMYGAGGQKRVPDDFVKDFEISRPSMKEQRTIADFLDGETAKIDSLVAEQMRAVALLRERRSALISAAVTGKIDVRNSVAYTSPTQVAAE